MATGENQASLPFQLNLSLAAEKEERYTIVVTFSRLYLGNASQVGEAFLFVFCFISISTDGSFSNKSAGCN